MKVKKSMMGISYIPYKQMEKWGVTGGHGCNGEKG
jgi:hypothetical protein